MKHFFTSSHLALFAALLVIALAVGVSAYNEPFGAYPANTQEPIDISTSNQAKVGPLSVWTFLARGNADFKKDLAIGNTGGIVSFARGCTGTVCDPTNTAKTSVGIADNVLAIGDIHVEGNGTLPHTFQSNTLRHPTDPDPKPVCADNRGIIVFCPGPTTPPPPVDICPDNIAGNPIGVQTANPDIEVDPVTGKCTQVIKGTIYAGIHGPVVRNMAGNAYLASLYVKNITITSIGGNTNRTTWPSPTPLRFEWMVCSKWNPAYSGPTELNEGVPSIGPVSQGVCIRPRYDYQYKNALPYGFFGRTDGTAAPSYNGRYVAWDGIHSMTPYWFDDAGTSRYIDDPHGFFDAKQYDQTGDMTGPPGDYVAADIFMKWGQTTENFLNITMPLERLILNNVKVPVGYKLELTTNTVKAPGTIVTIYPATNSAYISNANAANVTRVNVYKPGGFGVDLDLTGRKWADKLPDDTYQVSVHCSAGTGIATPSSFTLPYIGGVPIEAKCQ